MLHRGFAARRGIARRRAGTSSICGHPRKPAAIGSVKVIVEVEGKLKLNPDGKEVQHLPLKVAAELSYAERSPRSGAAMDRRPAGSHLSIGRGEAQAPRIRDGQHARATSGGSIVVESSAKSAQLFSPEGPLTREELELVETPASGLALESLLPPRVVKIGSTWQLADNTVARLLGLEAVSKQDCTAARSTRRRTIWP